MMMLMMLTVLLLPPQLQPLLLPAAVVVRAEKDSNPYPYGTNPNTIFQMYWNDAGNVLQDLSKFSALFIRYHGCVWSECSVDNYDDDGEDRDGGNVVIVMLLLCACVVGVLYICICI
jgi:hypothetical protein